MAKRTKGLIETNQAEEEIRLNKYLSDAGICSRREADGFIAAGQVTVDGVPAVMGTKVKAGQKIMLLGKEVSRDELLVLIAFHKPRGIVCTTDTKEKDNIIDYINYGKRIYPIGRLDKDSEGLILLTNDGNIVNKILRAGNNHEKEYLVTVNQPINLEFLNGMAEGVPILDTVTKPCRIKAVDKFTFQIILTQGLNRQIRRMCEYFGYKVLTLKRVRIMNINLGHLHEGDYRNVTEKEIAGLNEVLRESVNTPYEAQEEQSDREFQISLRQAGKKREKSQTEKGTYRKKTGHIGNNGKTVSKKQYAQGEMNQKKRYTHDEANQKKPYAHDETNQKKPYAHDEANQKKPYAHDEINQKKPYAHDEINQKKSYAHDRTNQKKPYTHDEANQKKRYTHDEVNQKKPYTHDGANQKKQYTHDEANQKKPDTHDGANQKKRYTHDEVSRKKQYAHDETNQKKLYAHDGANQKKQYTYDETNQKKPYVHDKISRNKQYVHSETNPKTEYSRSKDKGYKTEDTFDKGAGRTKGISSQTKGSQTKGSQIKGNQIKESQTKERSGWQSGAKVIRKSYDLPDRKGNKATAPRKDRKK